MKSRKQSSKTGLLLLLLILAGVLYFYTGTIPEELQEYLPEEVRSLLFEPTPTPVPVTPKPVLAPVAGQEWRDPITGMEFVRVPSGCFHMGQTEHERRELIKDVGEKEYKKRFASELPRHKVCLDGFWMGKYEVTQAEWQKVMDSNPSYFKGETRPVEMVSWDDTQAFIQKLNSLSDGMFRLPSEVEWEYACRAGSQTTYSFGHDSSRLREYAWYSDNSGSASNFLP